MSSKKADSKQLTDDEQQDRFEEINTRALAIADAAVSSTIRSMTIDRYLDKEHWRNLATDFDGQPVSTVFSIEVEYAEMRGMLKHHPTRPELVQIVQVPA